MRILKTAFYMSALMVFAAVMFVAAIVVEAILTKLELPNEPDAVA